MFPYQKDSLVGRTHPKTLREWGDCVAVTHELMSTNASKNGVINWGCQGWNYTSFVSGPGFLSPFLYLSAFTAAADILPHCAQYFQLWRHFSHSSYQHVLSWAPPRVLSRLVNDCLQTYLMFKLLRVNEEARLRTLKGQSGSAVVWLWFEWRCWDGGTYKRGHLVGDNAVT